MMTIASAVTVSVRAARSLKVVFLVGIVLLFGGCGPILGQIERVGEGMSSFSVVEGQLSALKAGSSVLVFGPFDKTEKAYYICRGEDAARYDEEFRVTGFFGSSLYLQRDKRVTSEEIRELRSLSSEGIRERLALESAPEWILFGTLLERRATVAPTRGIVMVEGYRLDFYNPDTRSSVVVESFVKVSPEKTVPRIVRELLARLRKG